MAGDDGSGLTVRGSVLPVPPLSESRTPPVADLRSCVLLHVRGGAETTYGYGINYARGRIVAIASRERGIFLGF